MVSDASSGGKKMSDPSDLGSDIADFYRGRSIFITGVTGFMGKVLLEKLLRACPGITRVYVLIRPKNGNDVQTRLMDLLNSPIFEPLREDRPDCFDKVTAVSGDISLPNLGISAADHKTLCENVSVVFHSAATVKFDEPLKISILLNVLGTRSLVQLCHNMVKLEAVVHVSTAYCNCDRRDVNESLYPPPDDPAKLLNYAEWMDEEILDSITPRILQNRPNTYTYTKALAEHVFVTQGKGLPGAIVRPSIVTAAWREPIEGWIDNLNGPTGMLTGAGKGILRTFLCYRNLVADLIPVDIPINLMIAVAWHTAMTKPSTTMIYHCTSGKLNPIRWGDIEFLGQESINRLPFNDVVWYPGGSFKSSRMLNNVCVWLFHLLPAYVLDATARLSGKKPVMVRIQKKFQKAILALEFFTTHEWQFAANNLPRLYSKLSDKDKEIFNFNVKQVNWKKYMDAYVQGIKLYILKEDSSSNQEAKKHLRKMYFLHKATQILTFAVMWSFVFMRNEKARKLCYTLWALSLRFFRAFPISGRIQTT